MEAGPVCLFNRVDRPGNARGTLLGSFGLPSGRGSRRSERRLRTTTPGMPASGGGGELAGTASDAWNGRDLRSWRERVSRIRLGRRADGLADSGRLAPHGRPRLTAAAPDGSRSSFAGFDEADVHAQRLQHLPSRDRARRFARCRRGSSQRARTRSRRAVIANPISRWMSQGRSDAEAARHADWCAERLSGLQATGDVIRVL